MKFFVFLKFRVFVIGFIFSTNTQISKAAWIAVLAEIQALHELLHVIPDIALTSGIPQ